MTTTSKLLAALVGMHAAALDVARRLDLRQEWDGRDAWVARLDRIDAALVGRYGVYLPR